MKNERITESELVLPSLYIMHLKKDSVKTTELIKLLEQLLHPTGKDLEILKKRKDSYFSQKVRNLKSHNTFERKGYAKYADGSFSITKEGEDFVLKHYDSIEYLFTSDFDYDDIRQNSVKLLRSKEIIPYNEIIEEGGVHLRISKRYKRSKQLRDAAIQHFSQNGNIKCNCCNFDFSVYYGDNYGKPGCIEFHHIKPIFQYSGVSNKKTIEEALKNILPVCPNCHRVIHKKHISGGELESFKKGLI